MNNKIKTIILVSCSMLMLASCANELDSIQDTSQGGTTAGMSLQLSSSSPKFEEAENSLEYKVFFYRASLASQTAASFDELQYFAEKDWMNYNELQKYQFSISNKDLAKYVYRIVIIAGPGNGKYELAFDTKGEGQSYLSDFKISRRKGTNGQLVPLTKHNYIGSTQLTEEIIKSGSVKLKFERLVGQLIFDVGRYDAHSTSQPLDADFNSTFDRVNAVTFTMNKYADSFYYFKKSDNAILSRADKIETVVYDLSDYLEPITYKMSTSKLLNTPNGDAGILCNNNADEIQPAISVGTTRIYGPYQLENQTSQMSVNVDFQYYDTQFETPLTQKHVILTLPQQGKKLNVKQNHYTTTKIKIVENRIIDITKEFGDINFDHTWQ